MLPNEVWCEILISLEHHALRTCAQVSKRFNALVMSQPFDSKLFRGPLVVDGEAIQIDLLELHPAFDMMFIRGDNIDNVQMLRWNGCDFSDVKFKDTGAANELATVPGVKIIYLQINDSPLFEVKHECGVTVLQVVEVVLTMFTHATALHGSQASANFSVGFSGFIGWNENRLTETGHLHLRSCSDEDSTDELTYEGYGDHFNDNDYDYEYAEDSSDSD